MIIRNDKGQFQLGHDNIFIDKKKVTKRLQKIMKKRSKST